MLCWQTDVSLLGPVLGDIFIANLENGAFQSTIEEIHTWDRNVDSIFIFISKSEYMKALEERFNQAYSAFSYTDELKQEN